MLPETITLEQDGHVVTARLHESEVSYQQMQALQEACVEKMRYDNARNFIIDLSEVDFLASACIGSLVELLKELEHQRGQIALVGCKENVAFLFKVTRLDAIFQLFDDAEDAASSF